MILRSEPATGSTVEISRNGPQGNLFKRPYDLAVEPSGSIVVADMGVPNQRDGAVIRVDPVTGRQSVVSSGGYFFDPAGIAIGPGGVLYVLDNLDGLQQRRRDPGRPEDRRADLHLGEPDPAQAVRLPFGIAVDRNGQIVVVNRSLGGAAAGALRGRHGQRLPGQPDQRRADADLQPRPARLPARGRRRRGRQPGDRERVRRRERRRRRADPPRRRAGARDDQQHRRRAPDARAHRVRPLGRPARDRLRGGRRRRRRAGQGQSRDGSAVGRHDGQPVQPSARHRRGSQPPADGDACRSPRRP